MGGHLLKSLKVDSIRFDNLGFRKLSNLDIPISPRLTVIAGHNGIGKSSILGLIANSSALTNLQSYFDKSFRSEFNELFYLDAEKELKPLKERGYIFIDYLVELDDHNKEIFTKRSSIGANTKIDPVTGEKINDRLRVIPRSENELRSKELGFSKDGKMPLPTIYLGMSRITPIGEIAIDDFEKKEVRSIDDEDKKYFEDLFKSVIDYQKNEDKDCIVDHNVKGSKKKSKLPNTEHSTLAISLGQDSLSTIITALASFNKVKREQAENYIGGLLLIDEVEAGLHPRAQVKLLNLLKKEANKLNLQIIVTSHSLTVLKFIFDLDNPKSDKVLDSVIYLTDTRMPKLMRDPTYTKVKHDMLLISDSERNLDDEQNEVKIYFEDDEAKYFFEQILESKNLTNGEMAFGVKIKPISLKVGCEILIKLAPADEYFKQAVLIADNDVASKQSNRRIIENYKNFCALPQSIDIGPTSPSKSRNPESLIYDFIKKRFDDPKSYREFWDESDSYTTDYVSDHVLNLTETQRQNREEMKTWFKKNRKYFDERKILHLWCEENSKFVDSFIKELTMSIDEAVKAKNVAK